jgi:echinoid protein
VQCSAVQCSAVQCSDPCLQVGKAEVDLDVQYGPEVTVPGQREVAHGEEVVVNCQVSANPSDVSIVWTKQDDPSFRQTGQTLRLSGSNAAAVNNGEYTCTATNYIQPTGKSRMERTGNATIAIAVRHAPGDAFIGPDQPTAYEGKPITLECGAKPPGHPLPTYRWWKEGSENTVLATGAKFTIDTARLSSAGSYFCQPSNDLGQGSAARARLEVLQEPKIKVQLLPHIIKRAGDTGFHVTCSAVGKPKPSVRWFKDGHEIDGATSNLYQVSQTEQESRTNEAFNVLSTLKFVGPERIHKDQQYQLMPRDRGHYTCQFENQVDHTESTMLLRIEHQPVVRHRHSKVAADLGQSASISCKMQAYPSLKFEWYKGSSLLTQRDLYSMNTTELKDDIYEGILNIAYVEEDSYDSYTCKAQNSQGAKKTIIRLQPKGKPERPQNVRALDKGYDMITLQWDEGFNGGFEKTTYNVEYKEVGGGNTKYADCRWRNPCNISGLDQYTTYQFKVKSVNIRGESGWSRDIQITTAVDVTMIPTPEHVYFETSSDTVSFNVVKYSLPLVAKIELQNADNTWTFHEGLRMNDLPYGQIPITGMVNGLRVKVCLQSDEELCGPYTEAELVEEAPTSRPSESSSP